MEKLLEKFFRIPVYHPKASLAFLSVVTIIALLGIPGLRFENSLEVMMPQTDSEYLVYRDAKKVFGNNGKFIILDVSSPALFTPAVLADVDNLVTDIEEYGAYDEEKENARLNRITDAVKTGEPVSCEAFIRSLSDDPPFARMVSRRAGELGYTGEVLATPKLGRLKEAVERDMLLKKEKYVDTIISPLTMKDLSGKDDTLAAYDLVPADASGRRIIPASADDMKHFEAKLRRNPAFRTGIYSEKDGKITDFGILVRLAGRNDDDAITREIWSIAQHYNKDGMKITAQGSPVLYKQITDYMQRDLRFFVPLVLLVICVVFFLNFRTVQGVVLPLITLILADIWVLGLMGHLGFKISVIGISLPPLIISVGSSYSIHIMNRFIIDSAPIRQDKHAGLHSSMNMIGMTLLLASLTTIIGFATNMATRVGAIFEWGVFAALGTFFAVIIASLFIPAVFNYISIREPLEVSRGKTAAGRKGITASVLDLCAGVSVKYPAAVITVTAVIALISAAGIARLKTETSLQSYFKADDYINTSNCEIGRNFGGTMAINILVDSGTADGVKNPDFLRRTEELRNWLTAPENADLHIGRTDAFGDFVKTMHMAMQNDDPAYYTIPDSEMEIFDYFEIYSGEDNNSDGRADELEQYVDPSFSTVSILARMYETEGAMLGTSDINRIVNTIKAHAQGEMSQYGYSVTVTGEPLIIMSLAKYIVQGQLWSLFLSLIAVSIVVVILFRSRSAGLISAIPISAAVVLNFGVMGWTGIRLDIATAIIASITVGIGVDNTIHFLNNYRHFCGKDLSTDDSITAAISTGGTAIIYSALALICGFSVLVISKFQPILLFGVMMGFTFVATTTGALLILPAVVKLTGFRFSGSEELRIPFLAGRRGARGTEEGDAVNPEGVDALP